MSATLTESTQARAAVIALHCSGASPRQWRHLAAALGPQFLVRTPELYGSGAKGAWPGHRAFTLADEAAETVRLIDRIDLPVHLVGHSYGGAVALRAALTRPTRVASLALYEPFAADVLASSGPQGRNALQEIRAAADVVADCVGRGDFVAAARRYSDYWSEQTWAAMSEENRADLARYIPTVRLQVHAVFGARIPLVALRRLRIPALLMAGSNARAPLSLMIEKLARVIPGAVCTRLEGADHTAPLTRPEEVAGLIAAHLMRASGLVAPEPRAAAARLIAA